MTAALFPVFFAGLLLGAGVGVFATIRALRKSGSPAWGLFAPSGEKSDREDDFDAWVTSGKYPRAYMVVKVGPEIQNIGQVSTGELRARALAREERAKIAPQDRVDLVEYRAHRRLEV